MPGVNDMNNRISLFVIMINVFSSVVLAVPKNITVDNSQLQSGKLTITGTGFGAQAANVIMYDRFESTTAKDGDQIPLNSPDIGAWSKGSLIYNSMSHSGQFSGNAFTTKMKRFTLDFGTGVQEIFLSYWLRLPDGQIFPGRTFPDGKAPGKFPNDSSWKFTWLWDLDRGGSSNDLCLPTHVGHEGIFYLGGNDFNLDTKIGNRGTWWSWNSWMRISVWLRANPSDPLLAGDVLFQTISAEKGVREYKVSKPIFDSDFNKIRHRGLPDTKQYQHISFPGWMREETEVGTTPLYDDIYVAIGKNSLTRVEIADSPDYKKAKKVAIQKVISWSDTNIEVDVVDDNFGENLKKAAFIFVWDKDGNRNAQGIPVLPYPKAPTPF